ncbi:hypothetical protein SpAn4DRAFT_0909 [Sporomusa ovata]|uniref:Uncharacterized protein n=1 Tax=Sporomusa ovata TaxID=2378 RepID=A0A0U1L412_9FIRM|nr:hypothetical protein SpAn4DRAFT_0909 [Sporomusa ovata]
MRLVLLDLQYRNFRQRLIGVMKKSRGKMSKKIGKRRKEMHDKKKHLW